VQVGGFRLEKRIGAGGMGEVWRARHPSGAVAAIKFDLNPPDDAHREAFFHEVRLVAGLDHPHCVQVFDTGQVNAAEARDDGGPLRRGAPWLAMELARGGSMADPERVPRSWAEVSHVTSAVLRGLAHAHARGIVHRDIKPGNLLLAGPRGLDIAPGALLETRPVLSDFGIGLTSEHAGLLDTESVGTPRFMAPEMIEARWRDYGPWTDLYAVGVMVWLWATGEYPLRGAGSFATLRAHLYDRPGAFAPRMDVPAGLEGWCRGLLAKAVHERPAFAAEALERLLALGAPVLGSGSGAAAVASADAPTVVQSGAVSASVAPPSAAPEGWAGQPRGAGLGLWGLRPAPLIGRADPQATLWTALREVQASGRPSAVVLRGPAGVGTSRLARWLLEAAHEAGVATGWRARHGEVPDPGIAGMLRRELRLGGLTADEASLRLTALRVGDDALVDALVRWLVDGVAAADARQRGLAARVLERDRPQVVWIDGAERGAESVDLARHLLARGQGPVLVALSVEEPVADPAAAASLAGLARLPRVVSVELGPLGVDDHRALVRGLLGFEGPLALEIEAKTAGNPRFAVDLVSAWVAQGVLDPGPRGLRLRPGVTPTLPTDLLAAAEARVAQFLRWRSPDDALALERAAFLGDAVGLADWRAACAAGGVTLAAGLVGDLLAARVLWSEGPGRPLAFASADLRAYLLARAQAAGQAAAHARACAEVLAARAAPPYEQLAALWRTAGQREEASRALIRAIDHRHVRGDHRTDALLDAAADDLRALGAPPADPRRGELLLLRGSALLARGDRDEAEVIWVRAEREARQHGWREVEGVALRNQARLLGESGDRAGSVPLLERAEAALRAAGRTFAAADCRVVLGDAHAWLGRWAEAEAAYASALGVFDHPDAWFFSASPQLELALLFQRTGRLDAAAAALGEAEAAARRHGLDEKLALIANVAGEIARARGALEEAEQRYAEAARRWGLVQDERASYPILNVGVLRVLLGRFAEARAMVEPLRVRLARRGAQPALSAYACAVLLAAAADDAPLFDACLRELESYLDSSGEVDADIAAMCEAAADRLTDPGRRVAVRRIARDQRSRLAAR